MVKHAQTIRQQQLTNCLSVFEVDALRIKCEVMLSNIELTF